MLIPTTHRTLRRDQTKAFTLIELLSVIAIIGVLAGIIFVGVQTGIRRAHATTCASNLRQIGMAMSSYMAEHKGHIYDLGNANEGGGTTWNHGLALYLNVALPALNQVPTGVWACPDSQQIATGSGYSHYSSNYVSFGSPTDVFPKSRASAIDSPGKVIAFTEGAGAVNCTRSIAPWNGLTANIDARHDGKANVVYFDLHVAQLDPKTLPVDSSLNRTLPPWH